MEWIILSIITAAIYSFTAFLDNYTADVIFNNNKPQSIKVFNGVTYLIFAFFLSMIFGVAEIPGSSIALLMLAGVVTSISSIPYYLALKDEEATGAAIFYQMQPIFYLIASVFFFNESISIPQIIALVLIMLSPIVIILSRRSKKSRQRQINTTLKFVVYVFLLSISGIITTHAGDDLPYMTVFTYFLLGRGLSDAFLSIAFRSWREQFKKTFKKTPGKLIGIVSLNQFLCIVAEYTSRLALIIGSSAIVSALVNSSELILTFLMGIIFTIKWPKFGREELKRHVIIAHVIGIVLCIAGVLIMELL